MIAPSTINPAAGQTVTYRVPDWSYCSPTPNFTWTLSVNQGSATSSVIDNGQAVEVQYGNTLPLDVDVTVTDTVSGCSYTFAATSG